MICQILLNCTIIIFSHTYERLFCVLRISLNHDAITCYQVLAKHQLIMFDGKALFKELVVLGSYTTFQTFFQPPAQTCLKGVSVF